MSSFHLWVSRDVSFMFAKLWFKEGMTQSLVDSTGRLALDNGTKFTSQPKVHRYGLSTHPFHWYHVAPSWHDSPSNRNLTKPHNSQPRIHTSQFTSHTVIDCCVTSHGLPIVRWWHPCLQGWAANCSLVLPAVQCDTQHHRPQLDWKWCNQAERVLGFPFARRTKPSPPTTPSRSYSVWGPDFSRSVERLSRLSANYLYWSSLLAKNYQLLLDHLFQVY